MAEPDASGVARLSWVVRHEDRTMAASRGAGDEQERRKRGSGRKARGAGRATRGHGGGIGVSVGVVGPGNLERLVARRGFDIVVSRMPETTGGWRERWGSPAHPRRAIALKAVENDL